MLNIIPQLFIQQSTGNKCRWLYTYLR